MRIVQNQYTASQGWVPHLKADPSVSLVFIFGSTACLRNQIGFLALRTVYPKAIFFGCSTAGEIAGTKVADDSMVATAVYFQYGHSSSVYGRVGRMEESLQIGAQLGRELPKKDLAHVFLLSDGLRIETSHLLQGLARELPDGVAVTGGLAGDGIRFDNALVLDKNGLPSPDTVAALGFYGDRLKVGYASQGGWVRMGLEATVTRSKKNVLYELDGKPALKIYKQCLDVDIVNLPVQGILFPLNMRKGKEDIGVIRTVLAVDENEQSLSIASELPEGCLISVMKAGAEQLTDGASVAATASYSAMGNSSPDLALLVSCVGRKFILGPRIDEELLKIRKVLGEGTTLAGFYSYGEISPYGLGTPCQLHNQTMTITTLVER